MLKKFFFKTLNDIDFGVIIDYITPINLYFKDGIDIEVDKHKNQRSNNQNAFYHANISDLVRFLNENGSYLKDAKGNKHYWTSDLIHETNKRVFGIKTTTKLSIKEFIELMDKFFAYWIDYTNGFFEPKEATRSYMERVVK